jgi:hypothetical protein
MNQLQLQVVAVVDLLAEVLDQEEALEVFYSVAEV